MLKPVLHKINFVECKSYGFNLEVDFAWEPTVFWVDITVTVQAENVSCVLAVYMPFWQASLMTWQMHVSPLNQLPLTYRGSKLTCTIFQSRFRVPCHHSCSLREGWGLNLYWRKVPSHWKQHVYLLPYYVA